MAEKIYSTAKPKNIFSVDAPVSGGDVGARNIITENPARVLSVAIDSPLDFFDIDSIEDFAEFEDRLAGSAIRRIGYQRWLRNLAVGLGNARDRSAAVNALRSRIDDSSALVREHVQWALDRHGEAPR